jgi:hypothetical protein
MFEPQSTEVSLAACAVGLAVFELRPDYHAPLLVGEEPFDAVANGETVAEYPEAGEVVWRDDAGVTCRRWNWRLVGAP